MALLNQAQAAAPAAQAAPPAAQAAPPAAQAAPPVAQATPLVAKAAAPPNAQARLKGLCHPKWATVSVQVGLLGFMALFVAGFVDLTKPFLRSNDQ